MRLNQMILVSAFTFSAIFAVSMSGCGGQIEAVSSNAEPTKIDVAEMLAKSQAPLPAASPGPPECMGKNVIAVNLQSIIDTAPSGSVITVPEGCLIGEIVINKTIHLVGAGADQTILLGAGTITVNFDVHSGSDPSTRSTIRNFRISHLNANKQTMVVHAPAAPSIENCVLTGEGILLDQSPNVTLINDVLGGLLDEGPCAFADCHLTIRNSIISGPFFTREFEPIDFINSHFENCYFADSFFHLSPSSPCKGTSDNGEDAGAYAPPVVDLSKTLISPTRNGIPVLIGTTFGKTPSPASIPRFTVSFRDSINRPIAGKKVELQFGSAPGVRLLAEQNPGVNVDCTKKILSATSDAAGNATFSPQFGGHSESSEINMESTAVSIVWRNNILGHAMARSTDIDAANGTNAVDSSLMMSKIFSGKNPQEVDFNLDGLANSADLSLFMSAFPASQAKDYCK